MAQFPPLIINAFTTLGLNKKHVVVLGHLYTLGRVRVHEISPDINSIRRTELYSLLNYLVKVRLVDKLSVNNVTCFELKPNSEIIRWANGKKLQAEDVYQRSIEASARIRDLLEEQERSIEPRPFFHYLEGVKGMETAHKIIMPHSESVDMYMNYGQLVGICPEYEKMLMAMLKDNIETKIRIILIDKDTSLIPRKLCENPRLFLRRNIKEKNSLLLCMGDKWVIDFAANGSSPKGFYMHCQNFDCMRVFTEAFANDWASAEEISYPTRPYGFT